jgi:hypothetical protein
LAVADRIDGDPTRGVQCWLARLDEAGYRSKMPENWNGRDPLARYKAVGIDTLENKEAEH